MKYRVIVVQCDRLVEKIHRFHITSHVVVKRTEVVVGVRERRFALDHTAPLLGRLESQAVVREEPGVAMSGIPVLRVLAEEFLVAIHLPRQQALVILPFRPGRLAERIHLFAGGSDDVRRQFLRVERLGRRKVLAGCHVGHLARPLEFRTHFPVCTLQFKLCPRFPHGLRLIGEYRLRRCAGARNLCPGTPNSEQ